MTRILFIAPGDNSHTWKWVGWFGRKYPGEISLLPYQAPAPEEMLPGVNIIKPHIPKFKIASMLSWSLIHKIKRIVNEIHPGILHILWAYGSGTYGTRCDYHPTILSPWGSDITIFPHSSGLKGAIQKFLIVESLQKADRITATSKFLSSAIHDLVPHRKHPDLFPYGVDTSIFDPDAATGSYQFKWPDGVPSGPGTITVGFFKALKPKYGPEFLVEAIGMASKEIPNLRCVMAGSGDMKDQLVGMAKSLKIENRIIFPGRLLYADMPKALKGIDIFAMPSRYEELGVAALEASSMCKPVIITKKWGMEEVAADGATGFFIEPGDVESLAKFIVQLASDESLRRKLGESGREFVKANYEFDTIMQRADKYCSEIISTA
jgi:L-malate glycosyltransferase